MSHAAALTIISLITAILGTLYAIAIRWLESADPDHGITPWLVVIGVSIVGLCYSALVYMWDGPDAALRHLGTLALLFALAGTPIIIGYYAQRIRDKHRPTLGG